MKPRWLWTDLDEWRRNPAKPVLVLTGARQVGKTTLARAVADDRFAYVALDDPIVRADLSRVSSEAIAKRMPAAIFDEVQKAPALVDVVKAIVDRAGPERYLLLGSSHVLLLDQVRESLVGRVQLRVLWPLALCEAAFDADSLGDRPAPAPALGRILNRGVAALERLPETLSLHPAGARLEMAMQRMLAFGGMPGLWAETHDDGQIREELETFAALYLERDLADLVRLRDLNPFIRLQRLAAERTGTVVTMSELARDAGVAARTAASYLRYLELSFQVVSLEPWYGNPNKRLVKSPRLHWTDVGIWRAVTRRWDGLSGPLYESAVVSEVVKAIDSLRLDWQPYHLRTYDQREVDLLLVRGTIGVGVEIKAGDRVHPHDARHLRRLDEITGLTHPFGLVVYRGRDVVRLTDTVWAVPDTLLFGPMSG